MDALKKKMQAMKVEKDKELDRLDDVEGNLKEATERQNKALEECDILDKKVIEINGLLETTRESLAVAEDTLATREKACAEAEHTVSEKNRHAQNLEEEAERLEEKLNKITANHVEASAQADESGRNCQVLESRFVADNSKCEQLNNDIKKSREDADETDRRYEEFQRKLESVEMDLERADDRAWMGELKVMDLEEELKIVGNNVKSLEVAEEKSMDKEGNYETYIEHMTNRLRQAETRAQFAERSVQKMQKLVDRLEDEMVQAREKNKMMNSDLEAAFTELSSY